MRSTLLLFAVLFCSKLQAQEVNTYSSTTPFESKSIFNPKVKNSTSREGKWYVFYGYNFSWYGRSDIQFKGKGYDFTLKDVKAHNRPSKLSWDYINPMEITTPQMNFRFGYFINDNYSISLGWDHMKYVMDIPQTISITGYIDPIISDPGIPTGSFAGNYNGEQISIPASILTYEHTDGFNYVSAEIERNDDIWTAKSQKNTLTMETGLGVGTVIPRSDVHLFGVGANHYWNFAGYGVSVKAGLKFHIVKGFYIQNTTKVGWSSLVNIHTTGRNDVDKAKQNISYLENYTVLGVRF